MRNGYFTVRVLPQPIEPPIVVPIVPPQTTNYFTPRNGKQRSRRKTYRQPIRYDSLYTVLTLTISACFVAGLLLFLDKTPATFRVSGTPATSWTPPRTSLEKIAKPIATPKKAEERPAVTVIKPSVEKQDVAPVVPPPTAAPVSTDQKKETETQEKPQETLPPPRTLKEAFQRLDSLVTDPIPPEVAALIAVFRDEENKTRQTRLRKLLEIGRYSHAAAPALPFLRQLLLDCDLEIRGVVFEVMEDIGTPSVPTIIDILRIMQDPTDFAADRSGPRDKLAYRAIASFGRINGSNTKDASIVLLELCIQSNAVFHYRQRFREPVTAPKSSKSVEVDQECLAPDATFFDKEALLALRAMRANPEEITPGLVKLLDTNVFRLSELDKKEKQRNERRQGVESLKKHVIAQSTTALEMLGESGSLPKTLVPPTCALLKRKQSAEECIKVLGKIGPDATDALELLRSQLPDPKLGLVAEEAIAQILRR